MDEKPEKNENKGRNNLVILGIASILIAVVATSVSLIIYHNSGDIYLDRSRPGYLPDKEEVLEEPVVEEYNFSKSGKITKEIIGEYLEKLTLEIEAMDSYEKPFAADGLSDVVLGIPIE